MCYHIVMTCLHSDVSGVLTKRQFKDAIERQLDVKVTARELTALATAYRPIKSGTPTDSIDYEVCLAAFVDAKVLDCSGLTLTVADCGCGCACRR